MSLPPLPLRPSRAGMSPRTRRRLAFVLGGSIVAIIAAAVLLAAFTRGESLLPVGTAAPDFTLHTSSGAVLSAASLRGKPALLVFCASWSSRCVAEVRALNRLRTLTRAPIVFVNGDSEDAASVSAFGRSFQPRFPLVLDPGPVTVSFPAHGPRGPVTARYRVTEFPTFYVVDPGGRVVWRSAGTPPVALLARELRRAARPVP